ncbi:MAG: metallophosphoesterase [Anaerolineae bacterium]|nr:metallophosphoesterase [Anaerolineae bacterium]
MTTRFWAIADTHLSFGKPRDMARFGERWVNHTDALSAAWRARIAPDDVVLLPGDVSWAQSARAVQPDLDWLAALPGQKVLLRGNHDHWWKDAALARSLASPLGLHVLEGDSISFDGAIVAGAMGHLAPDDPFYKKDPKKDRYTRELGRLERALEHARAQRQPGQALLLMMHFPPFTSDGKRTAYADLIARHRPSVCVYGHLHRPVEWEIARDGEHEGVHFMLVASDYLCMTPRLIWPPDAAAPSMPQPAANAAQAAD